MTAILSSIFGHLCGRANCFVVDGELLPVCQRCLGLYIGAALTAVWLAASGIWRRGLPSWGVFLANEAMLLAAMLGGAHVWGLAPAWKVTLGLWTGHVAVLWLVGGGGHLWRLSRPSPAAQLPWLVPHKLQALAAPLVLAALAQAIPSWPPLGWHGWSALAAAGGILLAAATSGAAFAATWWAVARLIARMAPTRCTN